MKLIIPCYIYHFKDHLYIIYDVSGSSPICDPKNTSKFILKNLVLQLQLSKHQNLSEMEAVDCLVSHTLSQHLNETLLRNLPDLGWRNYIIIVHISIPGIGYKRSHDLKVHKEVIEQGIISNIMHCKSNKELNDSKPLLPLSNQMYYTLQP